LSDASRGRINALSQRMASRGIALDRSKTVKSILRVVVSVGLPLLLVACAEHTKRAETESLEAISTVEARSDGTVVEATASDAQLAETKRIHEAMRLIDDKYLPPTVPDPQSPVYRVAGMSTEGIVHLAGGMQVRLDGINCSQEGVSKLSRIMLDPEAAVAFAPSSPSNVQPVAAEVWLVQYLDLGADKPAPSFTRIAESALLSGWCTPWKTATSMAYDGRYAAIAAEKSKPVVP
jgi:hypothetical protein